jgi:ubiquinone/menaquinone biosynthesis C-methylase UbiE
MKEQSKREVIERYQKRIAKYGLTFDSLGSGKPSHQDIRFHIHRNIGINSGDKILDIGCGLGDFYTYLRNHGINVDYHGVDLVPELIDEARKKNPDGLFEIRDIIEDEFLPNSFDYVVCSQVMNFKFSHEDNYEHAQKMLELMFKFSGKGVACDFLTSYVDFKENHLNYYNPLTVFDLAKSFTKSVDLIHSYPLFEFTIYLFPDFKGWSDK